MFDARRFFERLHGRSFTEVRELFRAVAEVRHEFLKELPADFDVTELIELARTKRWLVEDEQGQLRFVVDSARPAGTLTEALPT